MNGWINAKDRKPDTIEMAPKLYESEDVLGVTKNGKFLVVQYAEYEEMSWFEGASGKRCNITHWMPLPEPPKGDGKE